VELEATCEARQFYPPLKFSGKEILEKAAANAAKYSK
jgi:hypothetical protein